MAEINVINTFKQKTGLDPISGQPVFVPHPVGAEIKYVGAQRSSHNNNLEEQLIIGTDYQNNHSLSEKVSGNIEEVETILFRKKNGNNSYDENGYYKLTKTTEKEPLSIVDAENKKLTLNLYPKTISENEVLTYFALHNDITEELQVSSKEIGFTYNSNNDFNEHSHISNLNYEPV